MGVCVCSAHVAVLHEVQLTGYVFEPYIMRHDPFGTAIYGNLW